MLDLAFIALLERAVYRLCGIVPEAGQDWSCYAFALLAVNGLGALALYAILRLQGWLPWHPQGYAGMPPELAFNTAVSFVTNTNWQAYGGESTLSYFSQMAGLGVQNFLCAATGIAVVLALTRGLAHRPAHRRR